MRKASPGAATSFQRSGVHSRRRSANGRTSPHGESSAALPERSTSPAPTRRTAPESSTPSEELHAEVARWAAMIVDAYLRHLAAAAKREEEAPCRSPSPMPESPTAGRQRR